MAPRARHADAADDALVFHEDDERFFVDVRPHPQRAASCSSTPSSKTDVGDRGSSRPPRPTRAPRSSRRASTGTSTPSSTTATTRTATASSSSPTPTARGTSSSSPRRSPIPGAATGPSSSRTATTCGSTRVDAFARPPRAQRTRRRARPAARAATARRRRDHALAFPDPVYTRVGRPERRVRHARSLRYGYTSLVAPATDVDYDLTTRARDRRQDAAGARRLRPDRVHLGAAVGRRSRTARASRSRSCTARDVALDGTAPALLYGYGVVRASRPTRRSARRGSRCSTAASCSRSRTCAAAASWAARGTRTAGSSTRRNTFTDFIACAETLDRARATRAPARLVARGGSAGGLLMGAVANLRPDLFAAIVAEVPFVDVVTTMLDADAPAHDHRVGGVGRSARARRVRADEGVLALRQRARRGRTRRCS